MLSTCVYWITFNFVIKLVNLSKVVFDETSFGPTRGAKSDFRQYPLHNRFHFLGAPKTLRALGLELRVWKTKRAELLDISKLINGARRKRIRSAKLNSVRREFSARAPHLCVRRFFRFFRFVNFGARKSRTSEEAGLIISSSVRSLTHTRDLGVAVRNEIHSVLAVFGKCLSAARVRLLHYVEAHVIPAWLSLLLAAARRALHLRRNLIHLHPRAWRVRYIRRRRRCSLPIRRHVAPKVCAPIYENWTKKRRGTRRKRLCHATEIYSNANYGITPSGDYYWSDFNKIRSRRKVSVRKDV